MSFPGEFEAWNVYYYTTGNYPQSEQALNDWLLARGITSQATLNHLLEIAYQRGAQDASALLGVNNFESISLPTAEKTGAW